MVVEMEIQSDPPKALTIRHKCPACYKQFKRKDHLVEHMKISFHSVHQPKCPVCQKHCKSFESLRVHLAGPLAKANCSRIFSDQGCSLCLKIFDNSIFLGEHKPLCCLSAPVLLGVSMPGPECQNIISAVISNNHTNGCPEAVGMDCEMVSSGVGSPDLCARVCLIDEDENIIFHTYVQPQIPVADYRSEVTGLSEEHLKYGMPLNEVRERIVEILYNGESVERVKLDGGRARLLVGHDLAHDLDCLRMKYPDHMRRDTAKYQPLMKTNLVSHSLKYLTRTYLGYDIQTGIHDPYEDCVSVMRLYKRLRSQYHRVDKIGIGSIASGFDSYKLKELEMMSPVELYEISRSNYRCWCLDSRPTLQQ